MPEKIFLYTPLCFNTNQLGMHCEKCRTACPEQCIAPDFSIDLSKCNHCGLCVAACPAEAIFAVGYTGEDFRQFLAREDDTLWFSCQKNERESHFPCLGFLDFRLILVALYSRHEYLRPVVLDNSACAKCNASVAKKLTGILDKLDYFVESGCLKATASHKCQKPEKLLSRRDLFKGLFRDVMALGLNTLNQINGQPAQLKRQEIFAEALQQLPTLDGFPITAFKNIAVNETSCTACGECVKNCPQKSLGMQVEEGNLAIYSNSLGCTECGACLAACQQDAISLITSNSLETIHCASVPMPLCQKCGKPYQPINGKAICFECLLKE